MPAPLPFTVHAALPCQPHAGFAASLAAELGAFDHEALERGLAALELPVAGLAALGHPVRAGALRVREDGPLDDLLIDRVVAAGVGHEAVVAVVLCELGRRAGMPVSIVGSGERQLVGHEHIVPWLLDPRTGELVDARELPGEPEWRCGHQIADTLRAHRRPDARAASRRAAVRAPVRRRGARPRRARPATPAGSPELMVDFEAFDALTFDVYGTLIDWESGIASWLRPFADVSDDALLESFARHEAALEAGPYRRYREILAEALRAVGRDFGFQPSDAQAEAFGASVGTWPAFEDSARALAALKARYKLGVITNCDDDLFALSNRRLGVEFDWVITAQQAGGYKPRQENFTFAFERIDVPRERILHVAQSLFHDHAPAKALGMTTVWIDRRHGREGFGATPPAEAEPDLTLPDMRSLAALV